VIRCYKPPRTRSGDGEAEVVALMAYGGLAIKLFKEARLAIDFLVDIAFDFGTKLHKPACLPLEHRLLCCGHPSESKNKISTPSPEKLRIDTPC